MKEQEFELVGNEFLLGREGKPKSSAKPKTASLKVRDVKTEGNLGMNMNVFCGKHLNVSEEEEKKKTIMAEYGQYTTE